MLQTLFYYFFPSNFSKFLVFRSENYHYDWKRKCCSLNLTFQRGFIYVFLI